MVKLLSFVMVAFSTMVLLAACGGGGGDTGGGGEVVNVVLKEWSLIADRVTVPAGDVTFNVTNNGFVEHELVVLRTDLPADGLVVQSRAVTLGPGSEADEAASGTVVGRIPLEDPTTVMDEVLLPRDSASDTFNLTPGHYALICNRPTHYEQRQFEDFIVE